MKRNKITSKKKIKQVGNAVADVLHIKNNVNTRLLIKQSVNPDLEMLKAMDAVPKQKKKKHNKNPEARIVKECLIWLNEHNICAWRQNVGAFSVGNRYMKFGKPGSADITGLLPNGQRLEIEVKSKTGKQSETQKKFQKMIEKNNGVYLLVRSIGQLEFWLLTKHRIFYKKG